MSDSEVGFIKIYRSFFEHHLWNNNREFSKSEAWIWMLKEARYKPGTQKRFINDKLIEWERGEIPASLRYLKNAWNWGSTTKVRGFLEMLKKEHMVSVRKTQGQNVISICNYSTYNPLPDSKKHRENTEITHREHSDNTSITQNSKKVKKEKKESAPAREEKLFSFGQDFEQLKEMEKPLTVEQREKLAARFSKPLVEDVLVAMENHQGLTDKYKSVYLTALNWCKKRQDDEPDDQDILDNNPLRKLNKNMQN